MAEKINITDISKLRITKVKPWKIYFKYNEDEYMLIEDTDEDAHISLYKRYKLNSGNHRVECINGAITCMSISTFIKDISKKRAKHIVYANIDRNNFVIKLLELGFSTGYLEERQSRYNEKQYEIDTKIEELQSKITQLIHDKHELLKDKQNIRKLGSKTANANIIKREMAERVHGKKDGEWCEQYNDYYGNSDPIYGGKLTDLYNLPVGTWFNVANGAYNAHIGYNEHGDKCIVTDVNCIKLTPKFHSLYIELI